MLEVAVEKLTEEVNLKDRLSLRAVAKSIGLSPAMVHYHFKSKNEFITQILNEIIAIRKGHSIEDFYNRNKGLLKTRDGQVVFVDSMLNDFCESFSGKDEYIRRRFCILFTQIFACSRPMDCPLENYFTCDLQAFNRVCREITGTEDYSMTQILFRTYFIQLAFAFSNISEFAVSEGEREQFYVDRQRMLGYCKKMLLCNLNLLDSDAIGDVFE